MEESCDFQGWFRRLRFKVNMLILMELLGRWADREGKFTDYRYKSSILLICSINFWTDQMSILGTLGSVRSKSTSCSRDFWDSSPHKWFQVIISKEILFTRQVSLLTRFVDLIWFLNISATDLLEVAMKWIFQKDLIWRPQGVECPFGAFPFSLSWNALSL